MNSQKVAHGARVRGYLQSGNSARPASAAKGESWRRRVSRPARTPRTWRPQHQRAPPTGHAGAFATASPSDPSTVRAALEAGAALQTQRRVSLAIRVSCADPAALLPVPDRPLHFPLRGWPPLVTLEAIAASDSSLGGQRCGAWAGVGAGSAEGQGRRSRPAPSAGRGAQEAGATGTGAASQELCPSPRLSVRTGFAPPRLGVAAPPPASGLRR